MEKRFNKKDYRQNYDNFYITKFKVLYPEEVEKMRREIKEKYSMASRKTIERYVDNEILPPVMEKGMDSLLGGDIVYFSEINQIETIECKQIMRSSVKLSKFDNVLLEHAKRSLDILGEPEGDILKMLFGFSPYEKEYSQKIIALKYGLTEMTLSRKIKDILNFLREHLIKVCEKNLHLFGEDDTYAINHE